MRQDTEFPLLDSEESLLLKSHVGQNEERNSRRGQPKHTLLLRLERALLCQNGIVRNQVPTDLASGDVQQNMV